MPRAGLTTARVIDEAAQLADEVGLADLTLAALAERLGVRYPSLYKHVDGLDGLQRGLAVQAKNELAGTLARATVGRARGDAIVAVAHAYRTWALKHPGRYAAAQRVPAPGDTEAAAADWASVEVIGAILAGYDLHDDDAVDATRALRAALHGFVTLETTFVHPASIDRSFDRLVQGLATALASWADPPAPSMTGLQLKECAHDAPHGGQLIGCDGTKVRTRPRPAAGQPAPIRGRPATHRRPAAAGSLAVQGGRA